MVRLGASVIHIFTEAFAVLVLFPLIVKSTCFYPNGDTTSKQIPCNSGGTSVCCDQNWYCLSNGLCVDSRYENFQRVLRGSCTDKGGGGNCPTYCTKNWPQGDEAVYYCGNGKYCCSSHDCCSKGEGLMNLGEPQITATAGVAGSAVKATKAPDPVSSKTEAKVEQSQPTPEAQQPAPSPSQQQTSQQQQQNQNQNQEQQQQSSPTKSSDNSKPKETSSASSPKESSSSDTSSKDSSSKDKSSTASSTSDSTTTSSSPSSSKSPSSKDSDSSSDSPSSASNSSNNANSPATATTGQSGPTPTTATNPTNTSTSSTPSPKKDPNWTVIGIATGVGFAFVLVAALIIIYYLLRRKKKRLAHEAREKSGGPATRPETMTAASNATTAPLNGGRRFGDVEALVELEGDGGVKEMSGKRETRELDGVGRRGELRGGGIDSKSSIYSGNDDDDLYEMREVVEESAQRGSAKTDPVPEGVSTWRSTDYVQRHTRTMRALEGLDSPVTERSTETAWMRVGANRRSV